MRTSIATAEVVGEFSHIARIQNPACTNPERARVVSGWLLGNRVPDIEVQTSPDGPEANAVLLEQYADILAKPETLVVIEAGDGGIKTVAQCLAAMDSQATLFLSPGGNACDTFHAIIGELRPHVIKRALQHVRQQSFYPLQARIEMPTGPVIEQTGLGNFSLNISGTVANRLNKPHTRGHWLAETKLGKHAVETAITLSSAITTPPVRIDFMAQSGKTTVLRDFIVSNLPVMAKHGRFPVDPYTASAFATAVSPELLHPLVAVYTVRHLLNGTMPGVQLESLPDADGQYLIDFIMCDKTNGQMDGEHFIVPAGSHVRLGHGQPLSVLGVDPQHLTI